MSSELKNIIEAVLLVSDSPLTVPKIQALFDVEGQPTSDDIKSAIAELQDGCEDRGVELKKIGNGYRFQSKERFAEWIRKLYTTRPPRLSRALLETMSIIAYRQPVTRGDIEEVRGVSVSSEIMQRLQEREWVKQVGVRDVPGRPALYGTTNEFLAYFNLGSIKDLPELMAERQFSEISKDMESPLPPELLLALEGNQNQEDVFENNDSDEAENNNQEDETTDTDSDETTDTDSDETKIEAEGENMQDDTEVSQAESETIT